MIALLAQSTAPSPFVTAILFTAVSFPVGAVLGYLCGYRFKRQYERVARELASLKGENFRGELTTIGIRRPAAATVASAVRPAPHPAATVAESDHELIELRAEQVQLSEQLAEVREALAVAEARVAELTEQAAQVESTRSAVSPPTSPLTGTEAWQLAQMHKEQIMMQLRLDQHVERIAVLSQEIEATRQQVGQWRQRATDQERAAVALQREREQLQSRLAAIETA